MICRADSANQCASHLHFLQMHSFKLWFLYGFSTIQFMIPTGQHTIGYHLVHKAEGLSLGLTGISSKEQFYWGSSKFTTVIFASHSTSLEEVKLIVSVFTDNKYYQQIRRRYMNTSNNTIHHLVISSCLTFSLNGIFFSFERFSVI